MRALVAILLLVLSSPAAAQESADVPGQSPGTDETDGELTPDEQAYRLNEAGLAAFQEERFADAARAFAEAWRFSRDETLRKNEAIAWFRAGECESAVEAANKFLLIDRVAAPDKILVNSVIANCKAEFARRAVEARDLELADALLTDAEALETDSVAKDRVAAARVELASARREAEDAKPPPEPEIRTVYVPTDEPEPPYLGYALLGGGGALVLGTVVYHALALGWQAEFRRIEADAREGSEEKFNSLRDRVHVARIAVPIMYSAGVLIAGAGVTLAFFVEPSSPPASGEQAAPMTFGLRGRFR